MSSATDHRPDDASPAPAGRPGRGRLSAWLFWDAPLARVAWLRLAVYAFVVVDVLWLHSTGRYHGAADPVWYSPLVLGDWLGVPAATVLLAEATRWGSVAFALAAMTGRAPRMLGWATALCWIWFQYIAFAYGKVDHDRADFLVALLLLPTVGAAHLSDRRRSEAAGFALRAVQLMAIATYFLAAVAKIRFGGWEWVQSATIARAVVRRGTVVSEWMLDVPWLLQAFQWGLLGAELLSPVIFVLALRWQRRVVGAWYLFHLATYAAITIAFWPHLVMMLAFLPLERALPAARRRWDRLRGREVDRGARQPLVAPGRDG
ncbi:MFS transporter permease [Pseudokineococcus marinus]|uniref:MFS transporter permease n=1 Tax=Pseudokineococcus marinus TaxID=351215 RepID=A0A849BL86_9ACTN|nr:MFS transporter permease [Pseudokineococcus marinus]NNH22083.1 MFS transporter permease [Pseudokineococcus marinus]